MKIYGVIYRVKKLQLWLLEHYRKKYISNMLGFHFFFTFYRLIEVLKSLFYLYNTLTTIKNTHGNESHMMNQSSSHIDFPIPEVNNNI